MDHAKDLALAIEIHNRLNNKIGVTENAIIAENVKDKEYEPRTLIDNTLELIDPTPNIHTLFVQFNARYFWNKLQPIEVKWSNKMTACAGVCSFYPRNHQCIITLSAPLLKLRPRKDLVETLLHEMIHGYLFLTCNNRDKDGHGPEFHKHMYRINKEAGTKITVYHNFHDEVKLYQQHWWCCNGPCQKKAPYFGTVRRAMNRAPGPSDNWWNMHQQTCGGQFKKVRKPQKKTVKNKKISKEHDEKILTVSKTKDISDWFTKSDKPKNSTSLPTKSTIGNPGVSKTTKNSVPSKNDLPNFTKLGNTSNNIHGWGIGGPNSGSNSIPSTSQGGTRSPKFHAVGVLGGSGSGKSNLLEKFLSPKISGKNKWNKIPGSLSGGITTASENSIVDLTQTPNKRKSNDFEIFGKKLPKLEIKDLPGIVNCPICSEIITMAALNDHLDECLILASVNDEKQSTPKMRKTSNNDQNDFVCSPIVISDSSGSEGFQSPPIVEERQKCLVCDAFIDLGVTLNEHLEICIGSAFMEDDFPDIEDNEENKDSIKISDKNFPCPICMAWIHEPLMNEHLAICLNEDVSKN